MARPVEQFNERMSAEKHSFRLVSAIGSDVMPSSSSYELRSVNESDQTRFDVCYVIRDAPEEVAVQIAEAFAAGCAWVNPVRSRDPIGL